MRARTRSPPAGTSRRTSRSSVSDGKSLDELRETLAAAGYTTDAIQERLGSGRISFSSTEVAVHLRRLEPGERFSALVKLFFFGLGVPESEAQAAFGRSTLDRLGEAGWLEADGDGIRATLKLVPHGDLLVASDRDGGYDKPADWVAGVHPPSVTLAKLTVRRPVGTALDVATGNGIQALLASRHSEAVTASDINARALALAAVNARLNGIRNVELRQGSFFEPVDGERFDLVTCNPPYVISPESRYAYRDSGLPGDAVSRDLVQQAPRFLNEGGFAHILVSWVHGADDPWGPLEPWLDGTCDSWLLHFGSDDPISHAGEWLGPLALEDPARHEESVAEWLAYYERLGIDAIAHGAVILRRRPGGRGWVRRDTVALERLEQASDHVLRVFASQDYLEGLADQRAMLDAAFRLVESHRLEQTVRYRDGEADVQASVLALDEGLGFRIAVDRHTEELLPLLDGRRQLREVLEQRSRELGLDDADRGRFEAAALPAVRRLVELGFVVSAV